MIEDSEEMSATLKQQISLFGRLVAWVNSLLINTVATDYDLIILLPCEKERQD